MNETSRMILICLESCEYSGSGVSRPHVIVANIRFRRVVMG